MSTQLWMSRGAVYVPSFSLPKLYSQPDWRLSLQLSSPPSPTTIPFVLSNPLPSITCKAHFLSTLTFVRNCQDYSSSMTSVNRSGSHPGHNGSRSQIPVPPHMIKTMETHHRSAPTLQNIAQSTDHKPSGPLTQTAVSSPNNTSAKDTLLVLFTLTLIAITLYFTFYFWRKHRERPLATLYKLEEYRYSRLSQNELEVDSVVFFSDSLQQDNPTNSDECDDEMKPATLHVETDSLISISNCTSQTISSVTKGRKSSVALEEDLSDEVA